MWVGMCDARVGEATAVPALGPRRASVDAAMEGGRVRGTLVARRL